MVAACRQCALALPSGTGPQRCKTATQRTLPHVSGLNQQTHIGARLARAGFPRQCQAGHQARRAATQRDAPRSRGHCDACRALHHCTSPNAPCSSVPAPQSAPPLRLLASVAHTGAGSCAPGTGAAPPLAGAGSCCREAVRGGSQELLIQHAVAAPHSPGACRGSSTGHHCTKVVDAGWDDVHGQLALCRVQVLWRVRLEGKLLEVPKAGWS